MCLAKLLSFIFLLSGSFSALCAQVTETPTPALEAHEWGVLVNEPSNSLLTVRPKYNWIDGGKAVFYNKQYGYQAKEPVIYFHSLDKKPFSLKVLFPNGKPTSTYPDTDKSDKECHWDHVEFTQYNKEQAEDSNIVLTPEWPFESVDDSVPFEKLIPVMNRVDADDIKVHGQDSRFLYYEANVAFQSSVTFVISDDMASATVTNLGTSTVYDLIISADKNVDLTPPPEQPKRRFARLNAAWNLMTYWGQLDQLAAGETKTIPLQSNNGLKGTLPDIREMGFTDKEAGSFEKIWTMPVFHPNNLGPWQYLLYRLAPKDCEKVSKLQFDQPTKTIRALFVLVSNACPLVPSATPTATK